MEFLIAREDGQPLLMDASHYAAVLKPNSMPCRQVSGWGAHRIEVQGCPIVFGFEQEGITVTFQNWLLSEKDMARIVQEIAANLSRELGSPVLAKEQ
jgi:hypothetical protein